jgi:predicted Rdx family selenoprotein
VPLNADETAGRFRVWLMLDNPDSKPELIWDRKVEGGFPELKILVSSATLSSLVTVPVC